MGTLRIDEEIPLYQFAQGVRSAADLLDRFNQLDVAEKQKRFADVYGRVSEFEFTESDMEQALTDCSLTVTDTIYRYLNLSGLVTGSKKVIHMPDTERPPEDTFDKAYAVLLHLFKRDYQRRLALEETTPAHWPYQDLSKPEVVQAIRSDYQARVDEIYANPSFRSEFVCLAKLWHELTSWWRVKHQEPAPAYDPQTTFSFMTYDELVAGEDKLIGGNTKVRSAFEIVGHAVEKGLARRYGLDTETTRKLLFDVIERHLGEVYNTDLDGE